MTFPRFDGHGERYQIVFRKEVARNLGTNPNMLSRWKRQYLDGPK
ncbi:MAG: hypothetical protein DRP16_06245, partial [Candidatus Aenigmatarchaeota archaeon]